MCPEAPFGCESPRTLRTLTVLRTFDQVFCSVPLCWNFSPDQRGLTALGGTGGETAGVRCILWHSIKGTHHHRDLSVWMGPWVPGWGSTCQVSPPSSYSLLSSLPYCSLGEGVTVWRPPREGVVSHAPHLKGGVVIQALWDSSTQSICLYSSLWPFFIRWFEFLLLPCKSPLYSLDLY